MEPLPCTACTWSEDLIESMDRGQEGLIHLRQLLVDINITGYLMSVAMMMNKAWFKQVE